VVLLEVNVMVMVMGFIVLYLARMDELCDLCLLQVIEAPSEALGPS
jgi:hypothetical protein